MNKFGMIKRFLIVWIVYWLVYFLQPVQSQYDGVISAFFIQFLFVISLVFFYVLAALFLIKKSNASNYKRYYYTESINFDLVVKCGYTIAFVGTAFLAYDKIHLQGIDYFSNLAEAREQWRQLGEERDGKASSIYSAFGYVLGGAFFLPLGLVLSRHVKLTDGKRFKFFIVGFLLLMANSLMTGGRSSILLTITFVSFGYFSTSTYAALWKNIVISKSIKMLIFSTIVYAIYIFYSRAEASNLDVTPYALGFLNHLNLTPMSWFIDFVEVSSVGWILALINLSVSYLTHSLVTTAAIIGNGADGGDAIFTYAILLGAKLGVSNPPVDWFLSGRFPSMPGALYMQYGLFGLVLVAAIIGLIAGFFNRLFISNPKSVLIFLICASIESILLLSPFLFAGDFLFYPFMLFGGVLSIFLAKIIKLKWSFK